MGLSDTNQDAMNAALCSFLCSTFGCPMETAANIGLHATERRYPARTIIVKQGDPVALTFLLVNGRVHALAYGPDGQTLLLQEFVPGDFFGAIVESAPGPANADLVAAEGVYAAAFRVTDFLILVERYGCVGLAVSKMLLRQLQSTATKMAERSTLSAPGRVHAELLRLANLHDGRTIRPVPVLSKLALRVQSTRETVSRVINSLERRGIIRRDPGTLFIVAPHRLEDLVV